MLIYPWLDHYYWSDAAIFESGWRDTIRTFFAEVDRILRGTGATMKFLQIKEKLGSLRVYYRLRDVSEAQETEIRLAFEMAWAASLRTCIVCGADGSLRNSDGLIEDRGRLHKPFSADWSR